nr:unknown [Zea mays]|eukprot:NP_001170316.1 putative RING zinc finger domain superfamily protein [Zea mays]
MNERFPDATSEELDVSDATCIICREEMTTAKKLLCGHLFHVHCLRSWLERQHTCPTCRAPIIPADNGHAVSARQHGAQAGVQPAAGTATPSSEGAPGENMSRHQAKLEAAAAAASLYGRSFVYPPANTLKRSVPPQPASSTPQSEASSSNHQSQKDQEMQSRNSSDGLVPLPLNADGAVGSGTSTRDLENSLQKAQENFIKSQIEMLQIQLQMVQRGAAGPPSNENTEHTEE